MPSTNDDMDKRQKNKTQMKRKMFSRAAHETGKRYYIPYNIITSSVMYRIAHPCIEWKWEWNIFHQQPKGLQQAASTARGTAMIAKHCAKQAANTTAYAWRKKYAFVCNISASVVTRFWAGSERKLAWKNVRTKPANKRLICQHMTFREPGRTPPRGGGGRGGQIFGKENA